MTIPIFVRVIGLAGQGKEGTFGDLDDPSTHPVLIVCFGYNGFVESGFYLPELDELHLMDTDDEDEKKDKLLLIPKEDGRHQACLDTVAHFAHTLPTGGTPMDPVKIPSWLISKRCQRSQRLYKQMGMS